MQITAAVIHSSIAQEPFGTFEPFVSGTDEDAWQFYTEVLNAIQQLPGISVIRESNHHGSGYASYVSAFLYPTDGSTLRDYPAYVQTNGILLYMSRLAPVAVYGANGRTESKDGRSISSGFIGADNLGVLPDGEWAAFLSAVTDCLRRFRIEILSREPLLEPAPEGIKIPTVFDGPYYVFDTLFYWSD